jgi:hypothetical protein
MGTARSNPKDKAFAKQHFANRARHFVNACLGLPGVPVLPALMLATALAGTLAGAFGTGELPGGQRLAFWLILMGLQAIKWLALLAWLVKQPGDYWRAALIGALTLNPLIPLEVWLSYRLVGYPAQLDIGPILSAVLPLAGVILAVMAVLYPPFVWPRRRAGRAGPLAARQLAPGDVLAAAAEDHYCRIYLADGRQVLALGRFGDLLAELAEAGADGMQIHRGRWVAESGVAASRRAGRGWEVVLPCGTAMRVSAAHRAQARARGWLSRREAGSGAASAASGAHHTLERR